MASRIPSASATPDARRIAALAVSFLAHGAAALLIALPLAATLERAAPRVIEASVLERPPPPLPIPPEPEPLQRVRPPQAVPPPEARSVPLRPLPSVAPLQTAPEPVATPTFAAVDPAAGLIDAGAGAGNGESRILAYEGALKLAYPRAAIRRHAQGTVVLHVLVGTDGVAQRIELTRSSGHRELDDAARDAVRRARFRPVLQDGVAVPAWGLVPIEFRLDQA